MAGANSLMAASSASQGISSIGNAYAQSQAAKAQGYYQKTIYDINEGLAKSQAEDAIRRGDKEAAAHKQKTKGLIGAQRAAMAAQGIELDSGSALDVQMDTAAMGELDALTIRNNAWREAWGYRTQALEYSARGEFAQMSARNEARNTLLTGGLSAAKSGISFVDYGYRRYREGKDKPEERSG